MRGMRGMFTRIPGNLLEDSGECCYFIIRGNDEEDSGKCSRRFRGMFPKILGNDRKDSGECSRRFRGMFERITENLNLDLFCEILPIFLSNSAIKPRKSKGIFSALLITTHNYLLRLNTVFLPTFSFSISSSYRGNVLITVHSCRGIKNSK